MREIVLDVETTGLWVQNGHRVIEVACIELDNHHPTGRIFHRYINPLMAKMPPDAFEIHGIPMEFLWHHAPFIAVVDSLLEFIGNDHLVIHNAAFDIAFINNELKTIGRPPLDCPSIDTLSMARKLFPGAANSLDALCRRFGVSLDDRAHHGAMIDCGLLSVVYFELIGGRQPLFELPQARPSEIAVAMPQRPIRPPRPHPPLSIEEISNFETTLAQIENPIWRGGTGKDIDLDDEIPF